MKMFIVRYCQQRIGENTTRLTANSKMPFESLSQTKFSKHEQLLWKILPSNIFLSCSFDYRITLPMFVPVLGSALNEPEYCCISLASIRAALQIDKENDLKIMGKYAKNLLPILFSLYTNGVEDWVPDSKSTAKVDPNAVHQSTLATIRLYMYTIPKSLLKQYIVLATNKLKDASSVDEIISEQKILLVDILTAMCIVADVDDLQIIFNSIKPWFESNERPQKKAYRLLAQIYRRINEDDLNLFFTSNQSFLKEIIISGSEGIGCSSLPWRIAIYRNVLSSINVFDKLVEFCDLIHNEIMDHLNNINSKPARQQSANCLAEMSEGLLRLWSLEENSSKPNPLDTHFCKLFVTIKKSLKDNINDIKERSKLCCALIALNILTRKHLRNLSSATLVAQLIGCISEVLDSAKEASARLLAIRLMRTACSKMQPFMFDHYKNIILTAVFSQPISSSTVRTRKANSLLLDLLIDVLGVEELLSFVKSDGNFNPIWIKMLKNSDKMRRRKIRRKAVKRIGISSGIKKKFANKSHFKRKA